MRTKWSILLGLLLLAASAARAQYTYTTNNGTITILTYTGTGGAVAIPSAINGLPVTGIGGYAFSNKGLTAAVIPGSVTSIGTYAFAFCSKLAGVYFEGDAPSFGPYAFLLDLAVTAYHLPGSSGWASAGEGIASAELPGIAITCTPTNGNAPLAVGFTAAGADGAGDAMAGWTWDFGDGGSSTLQNPSHTYTNRGTFPVALLGYNSLGAPIAGSLAPIVVSAPVSQFTIAFTAAPTNGYAPLAVGFTSAGADSAGHAITGWSWSFGDGSGSTEQSPSHTYTNTGTFLPTLIATNSLGDAVTGSGPASIVALQPPQAGFTYSTNDGAITILTYTGPGGAVTIPSSIDGLPVTSIAAYAFPKENPTSVFVPGSVTVISGYAFAYCSGLAGVYFEGNAPTFGTFAFYYDFGATAYYLPGATGWASSPGDGIPTMGLPGIAITADPTNGVAPLTVSFTSAGIDSAGDAIAGWSWRFGDDSTSTEQNPTHSYASGGTFSVSLFGNNTLGAPIAGSTASIALSSASPALSVAFTAEPTAGYAPLTVSFTAAGVDSAGNSIRNWYWNFGDGIVSTEQNPSHTYADRGIFTIALFATNDLGGAVTGSGPASIDLQGQFTIATNNGAITITGYSGSGEELSIPGSIDGLLVTSIGEYAFNNKGLTSVFIPSSMISLQEGAFQYNDRLSVYFEGDAPSADSTVFEFSSATAYYLPGTTGWSAFSADAGVAAIELPGIGIAATPSIGVVPLEVSFTSTNVDGAGHAITNWNWSFGDGSTSTAQNPSHTYTNIGAFSVALVEDNGNGLPAAEATLTITVSSPSAIGFTASPTSGYAPLTVSLTAPGTYGGHAIRTWSWAFGDGSASSAQNPTHTYTNTGTYPLALFATNDVGATLTGSGPASISVTPEFNYATSGGAITITGYLGPAGALTIPASIGGLPVTGIAEYAFAGGAGLTSVTIPAGVTSIASGAFQNNPLRSIYFEGNAPGQDVEVFYNTSAQAVYYLPGTSGWGSSFDGIATVLWKPQIQAGGVRAGKFGFDIAGTPDLVVVVEGSGSLSSATWSPLATVTLTSGLASFSDPQWMSYPTRFYRLAMP